MNTYKILVTDGSGQPARGYYMTAWLDEVRNQAREFARDGFIGGDARVLLDDVEITRYIRNLDATIEVES